MTMKRLTYEQWGYQRTQDHEYKNILGFTQPNITHKQVVKIKGYTYNFVDSTGSCDNVEIFIENNYLYLYSESRRMGYAGLEVYHLDNGMIGLVEETFLQSDYEFMVVMDSEKYSCIDKFFNYSTRYKIKLLLPYFQFTDNDLYQVDYYLGEMSNES